jgi:hypothetical protein
VHPRLEDVETRSEGRRDAIAAPEHGVGVIELRLGRNEEGRNAPERRADLVVDAARGERSGLRVEEALDGLEHGVDGRALAGGAEEGEERRERQFRLRTEFSAAIAPVIDASAT